MYSIWLHASPAPRHLTCLDVVDANGKTCRNALLTQTQHAHSGCMISIKTILAKAEEEENRKKKNELGRRRERMFASREIAFQYAKQFYRFRV